MNDFEDRLRSQLHGLRDTIEPPPGLWARVEQRVDRRPWIPITMVAVAAAVLLFALIAGVGGSGSNGKRHIVAAGPGDTESSTTTDAGGGVEAPPTSQPPDTTTPSPTTTLPSHPTVKPIVPSTTPVPSTTATTEIPDCTSQDVSLSATTDKVSYARGETVNISVTATNTTTHPCQIPPDCGVTPEGATVTDSTGRTVWVAPHKGVMCPTPTPSPTVLQPGQSTQARPFAQFAWNQEDCPAPSPNCPGTQVPAGTYAAQGTWRFSDGTATGQPTDFRIT